MKRWPRRPLPVKGKRLEISAGGKWFLLFTLLLGVAAINSGNNVIYLIESLLLSALLFSGVLSELMVSRVNVRRSLAQAIAGEATGDIFYFENRSWFPIYCVEAGEWRGGAWEGQAFSLVVPPRSEVKVASSQVLPSRGRYEWDALAVATSFPFGFARKIRMLPGGGSRISWPLREGGGRVSGNQGDWEWEMSGLEELGPDEDMSRLHWPTTARTGKPMARPRKRISADEDVEIDLDSAPDREAAIRRAAGRLHENARRLKIRESGRVWLVEGSRQALDTLALLPGAET